jgi:hypothetical protein
VQTEPQIAFAAEIGDPPGLEIRINFGIFAGRHATAAEVDELAKTLVPEVGEVSIVAERRHEVSEDVEASLHQVRIEIGEDQLPPAGSERDVLTGRLLERAERWTEACIADRHAEIAAEL